MRRFYPFAFLLILHCAAFSQGFVHNNGAVIHVTDGALVIIKSDSLINSLSGNNGLISSNGLLIVEGNIHNDGVIDAANDSIKLTGDWINNNSYTGNNSWVHMYGANQLITGNTVTIFNNLALEGGVVVKRQTLNANTSALLQLNDAELATDSFRMSVTNTDVAAITWNSGFVSSVDTGTLSRATNTVAGYVFPLGSPSYMNAPSIFRPVQMIPDSGYPNTYAGALVKGDATLDGYDVNSLDTVLCNVNPGFYHRLYHTGGSDGVALAMYYNPVTDGNWTDEAHWKNTVWNYLGLSSAGTGLGLSMVTVSAVNDFVAYPFALARKKFAFDQGPAIISTPGQSVVLNPAVAAPAGSTFVWTPDSALSCADCANPTANPVVTTHYTVKVTDNVGCTVTDTLDVIVNSKFAMPDAFTPNGDGRNDLFGPLTISHVTIKSFNIYNRWGQLIHHSTDYWDGTFKGDEQPAGTYVYYIEVESPDPNNPSTMMATKQQGAVTLLR